MSEIELKPCPFCGGEARTLPGLRRVYCFTATCGAEMSAATVEGAIRLWNTRSQSERVSRLEEALEAVAAAMLKGGDGAEGDFGWNVTALNKARPLIRALITKASRDSGHG